MKAPFYFYLQSLSPEYNSQVSILYKEMHNFLNNYIDTEYQNTPFGNGQHSGNDWILPYGPHYKVSDLIYFKNKNYDLNQDNSINENKKRKEISELTEKIVKNHLEKLGYTIGFLTVPRNSMRPDPAIKNGYLCVQIGISENNKYNFGPFNIKIQ